MNENNSQSYFPFLIKILIKFCEFEIFVLKYKTIIHKFNNI